MGYEELFLGLLFYHFQSSTMEDLHCEFLFFFYFFAFPFSFLVCVVAVKKNEG